MHKQSSRAKIMVSNDASGIMSELGPELNALAIDQNWWILHRG